LDGLDVSPFAEPLPPGSFPALQSLGLGAALPNIVNQKYVMSDAWALPSPAQTPHLRNLSFDLDDKMVGNSAFLSTLASLLPRLRNLLISVTPSGSVVPVSRGTGLSAQTTMGRLIPTVFENLGEGLSRLSLNGSAIDVRDLLEGAQGRIKEVHISATMTSYAGRRGDLLRQLNAIVGDVEVPLLVVSVPDDPHIDVFRGRLQAWSQLKGVDINLLTSRRWSGGWPSLTWHGGWE